jgi:hypothetical protein
MKAQSKIAPIAVRIVTGARGHIRGMVSLAPSTVIESVGTVSMRQTNKLQH